MQHKLLFSAIALALSYSAQAVIVPEGTQLDEKQHIVINNGAEPQSLFCGLGARCGDYTY